MGAGALLTLELDCRWVKEKGLKRKRRRDKWTFENKRRQHTQEEVKKEPLEPKHKEKNRRKQYRGTREVHIVFTDYRGACDSHYCLQLDTTNAGCTFSENMGTCASAAKPWSGRHAVRQAKVSRAKEEVMSTV